MQVFFEMTISDDLRIVDIIYKDEHFHIWYDQYMGDYHGKRTEDGCEVPIGRYEYRNAPDIWNPLPNAQDFKNGFITDRLGDDARKLARRLNLSSPRLGCIYNAEEGKRIRIGDHYRDRIPDKWGVYYRDGAYFFVCADSSSEIKIRLKFSTEEEMWEAAERELLKLK